MKKKMLISQNAGLAAQAEQKAKEAEIFKLRFEEQQQTVKDLGERNAMLTEELSAMTERLSDALNQNEELKILVSQLKGELENGITDNCSDEKSADNIKTEETEIFVENQTESTIENSVENQTESAIENISENSAENLPVQDKSPAEKNMAELREYGAKVIARVTKATAKTLANIKSDNNNISEQVYNLALGKNEAVKYQIMALCGSAESNAEIIKKMDDLADRAIDTVNSFSNENQYQNV